MMKNTVFLFLLFWGTIAFGQPKEIQPLGNWQDTSITVYTGLNLRYNDVWGVTQNGKEYAVIGSTEGIHFLDISAPNQPVEVAFAKGADFGSHILHRDFKHLDHYLYAVSDEGNSSLQVIDFSFLPDSVHVVFDSNEHTITAHNLWVDLNKKRLYTCGVSGLPFQIYDLTDPANPEFLVDAIHASTGTNLPYAHDLYVRNDTAYLNCGPDGLLVVDCKNPNSLIILGSMTDYPQKGYNHSGWLDNTGDYYYLADETHGTDLKTVSTKDMTDLSVVNLFDAESYDKSIAHNLIYSDGFVYVSYYYDGLQVFDVHDPLNPKRIAYYDTYLEEDGESYYGAWGIFADTSFSKVLISDMQTGLYVFGKNEVILNNKVLQTADDLLLSPNPTSGEFSITFDVKIATESSLEVYDYKGQLLLSKALGQLHHGENSIIINDINHFSAGEYLVIIRSENQLWQKNLIKL